MLQIDQISKTYPGGIKALKNVSLKIKKGIFGLVGPNGSGKSTLMRTIATLQKPDQGSIIFHGDDIVNHPSKMRQKLGYLPQEFGLYPHMSAEKLLDYLILLKGIEGKKDRKELIDYLLSITNLQKFKKRKVGAFSGGMKQRFGIAQALIGDPDLIIVDEPTNGLDPTERNHFHDILSDIAENRIIIFSTHIIDDVKELANDMAIMHQGEIILTGDPIQLIENLNGTVWQKIIDKHEKEKFENQYPVFLSKLYCGKLNVKAFSKTPLQGFEKCYPSLEDVYFTTLKKCQNNETISAS
ncbi:MAG TPA: ABC transporter ATP-binding protein [Chlamydiales bacterium]|nr:ABC transporter ATP-binding protein [Chlamydiales bacterium]